MAPKCCYAQPTYNPMIWTAVTAYCCLVSCFLFFIAYCMSRNKMMITNHLLLVSPQPIKCMHNNWIGFTLKLFWQTPSHLPLVLWADSSMEEGRILCHQQSAGVARMWLGSVLAMLPFVTTGFTYAYSNLGLPQMLEPNGAGILIDIHELSWIGKNM